MKLALAAACAALLVAAAPPAAKKRRVFDPHHLADLEAIVPVLRRHVAELEIDPEPEPDEAWKAEKREAYGIVVGKQHLAVLSFLVDRPKKIMIRGPSGKPIEGKVVLQDVERRVAIVEAKSPLAVVGLEPAEISPKASRVMDAEVFALVSTGDDATVVHGVITEVGDEPEYEGHHRIDLVLALGMPVFDNQARFVGYSRAVAWDKDKRMLITPEMIREARTATGAADRERANPTPPKKPWWSR